MNLTAHESLSHSVVERVAEAENADPTDLEVPLYEVVDPDALDRLFSPADEAQHPGGQVTFTYYGYTVVVDSSGAVRLADEVPEPVETPQISQD